MFSSIDLSFNVNILLLLLLGIVSFLFSFFIYAHTVPPVPPRLRWILISLRALGVFLILAILFEPILKLIHREEKPPAIVMLIDDSKSMALTDRRGHRASTVQALLKSPGLQQLGEKVAVEHVHFAQLTRFVESHLNDSLTFAGDATNLAQALTVLAEESEERNIQGVILITDGNYNVGQNPLYAAETLGKPLYTIGIGDSSEQKDLLISKLLTNNIAYVDSKIPVSVTIKSSGFGGERVELSLDEAGKVIDQQFLILKEGTQEYSTTLFFTPHEEGMKKYTVRVSHLEGELTVQNNMRTVLVKVLKSKIKILLIAGAPSPDLAFLRRTLESDPNIQVTTFVQKSANEFYEGQPPNSVFQDHDGIILLGFPRQESPSGVLDQVRRAVDEDNQALFVILTRTMDLEHLRSLQPYLPFTVQQVRTEEVAVLPSVPKVHEFHTLLKLPSGRNPVEFWNALPPVYKTQSTLRAKPESEVIAYVRIQNLTLQEPLVVLRKVARRKSVAITGYGIWRWKLLAESSSSEEVFEPFIGNVVRWLTTREEEKQVKVRTTKQMYNAGERVEFTAQVYDERYDPVSDAEVRVRIQSAPALSAEEEFLLRPIGEGRFEGAIENLGEGDYSYSGVVSLGRRQLGEDRGRFTVGEQNLEFLATQMNKPLLRQLAYQTGGRYYDPEEVDSLVDQLLHNADLEPKEIVRSDEIELWNLQLLLGVIVLLFSTEWFLRKRNGML
ncbi:MAG: hypothetical protein V3U68_03385 [Bacteroidota bacterium]